MKHAESYFDCVPADAPEDCITVAELVSDPVNLSIAMTQDAIIAGVVQQIVEETHYRLHQLRGKFTWNDRDTMDAYRGLAIRLDAAMCDYCNPPDGNAQNTDDRGDS